VIADVGLIDEIVGARMEKAKFADRAVPALVTATSAVFGDSSSVAGTVALNWPALKRNVVKPVLFQVTALALLKKLPVMVRVNAVLPAAVELGERLVIAGAPTTNGMLAEGIGTLLVLPKL
jgi:hypothetical protein